MKQIPEDYGEGGESMRFQVGDIVQVKGRLYDGKASVGMVAYPDERKPEDRKEVPYYCIAGEPYPQVGILRLEGPQAGKPLHYNGKDVAEGKLVLLERTLLLDLRPLVCDAAYWNILPGVAEAGWTHGEEAKVISGKGGISL